jgi:L-ribulokinase
MYDGYVFGFDFGTLSCRLVAVNLKNGEVIGTLIYEYPHGVIYKALPNENVPLPSNWCLQHPEDWLQAVFTLSRSMLKQTGIDPTDVKSIGIDFTSCTIVPVAQDGRVLCLHEDFKNRPHAWPKLWKHHAAQGCAEIMEEWARQNTSWLKDYFGNNVSSEWAFPKIMQIVLEDYDCYRATAMYMEAVDWMPYMLSGNVTRCTATLGVNAFWIKGIGFPGKDFFRAMDPRMTDVVSEKMGGKQVLVGEAIGYLQSEMAEKMGLTTDTVICSGHSDGAVAGCGAGVTASGNMMLVMGTSTCHQMIFEDYRAFDGVCAIAEDGMIPGLFGYESGQPASGDIFQWYVDTCMPPSYAAEAETRGISHQQLMDEKAAALRPGENGLVALDWLNGNRSILSNYELSGTIVGLTLSTQPEEIYRALMEANLFGSRKIIENYRNHGITVDKLYAVGSLARKSPFMMQLCADIIGDTIFVPDISNVSAIGAAVCAAVALGESRGGFDSVQEAAEALIPKNYKKYTPDINSHGIYNELYIYYNKLHDYFGLDDSFMKGLRKLKNNVSIQTS